MRKNQKIMRIYLKRGAAAAVAAVLAAAAVGISGEKTVLAESGAPEKEIEETQTETAQKTAVPVQKNSKEENVYVLADASGTPQKVIVSDWLKNPERKEEIEDRSGLEEIENVKGDEPYEAGEEDSLTWKAGGQDIYYQGTVQKELPVSVTVSYELDGKEIAPQELAGKSGHVKMTFTYENKETRKVRVGEEEKEVKVPFAVISGVAFPTEHFRNVTVENGKCISEGTSQIAAGVALPGLKESLGLEPSELPEIPESVSIEADAEDFQMEMSLTLVMNQILTSLDEEGKLNMNGLEDVSGELAGAMEQLEAGGDSLADGLRTLDGKTVDFQAGADELLQGIRAYTEGASELAGGTDSLQTGAQSAAEGASELESGALGAYEGAKNLETGAAQTAEGAAQIDAGLQGLAEGARNLKAGTEQADAGAQSLNKGAENVAEGAAQVDAGIQALAGMLSEMGGELEKQADGYEKQLEELKQQESQLEAGISEAGQGLAQAEKALGEIQEAIDGLEQEGASMTPEQQRQYIELLKQQSGLQSQQSALFQKQAELLRKQAEAGEAEGKLEGALSALQNMSGRLNTPETSEQLQALAQGSGRLKTGSAELAQGAGDLAENLPVLAEGATQLSEGTDALAEGSKGLAEGTRTLSSGASALKGGLEELAGGSAGLKDGLSALSSGSQTLKEGAGRLNASGPSLTDGALRLKEGAGQMKDGIGQLLDGAESLRDGLYEFDSTGIQKIVELLDGTDTLEALKKADRDYQTFTALPEGMEGTVKFIIRTEAVQSE